MILRVFKPIRENLLNALLPLTLVAVILTGLEVFPLIPLFVSAIAMISMAGLFGEATGAIAATLGPRLSGLLNATIGNAAELIISIVAIRAGLLELVKTSITGSILGSFLIVLGLRLLLGVVRNGVQRFDREQAGSDTLLILLAITAFAIPSFFNPAGHGIRADLDVQILSLDVAGIMIIIYALGLFYSLRLKRGPLTRLSAEPVVHHKAWPIKRALLILLGSTVEVVWLSEILLRHIESATVKSGLLGFFLGVIILPSKGKFADHLVAVSVAIKSRMTLAVEIAVGSSLQIARVGGV